MRKPRLTFPKDRWPADAWPPLLKRGRSLHHWPKDDWKRKHPIRLMLRPWEMRVMEELGMRWGVPTGTVGWIILHERLAYFGRRSVELGAPGMDLVAKHYATRGAIRLDDACLPDGEGRDGGES